MSRHFYNNKIMNQDHYRGSYAKCDYNRYNINHEYQVFLCFYMK